MLFENSAEAPGVEGLSLIKGVVKEYPTSKIVKCDQIGVQFRILAIFFS